MENVTLVSASNGLYCLEASTGVVSQCLRDSSFSKFGVSYIGRTTNYLANFQINKPILHIWNNKSEPIYRVSIPEIIKCCVFQEDGGILYAGGLSGNIYIWILSTGQLLNCWLCHYKSISKMELLRNNSVLITCSDDCYIQAFLISEILESNFTLNIPKPIMRWQAHSASINDFIFYPNSLDFLKLLIISVGSDYTLNFFSFKNEKPLKTLNIPAQLFSCSISECHKQLFVGAGDGRIYRIFVEKSINCLEEGISFLSGHTGPIKSCKYLNNKLFSSASDGVRIWDIVTGTCLTHLSQFGNSIISIISIQPSLSYLDLILPPFKPFQKNISDVKKIFRINAVVEDKRQTIKQEIYLTSEQVSYSTYFNDSISMYLELTKITKINDEQFEKGGSYSSNFSDEIIRETIEKCISLELSKVESNIGILFDNEYENDIAPVKNKTNSSECKITKKMNKRTINLKNENFMMSSVKNKKSGKLIKTYFRRFSMKHFKKNKS